MLAIYQKILKWIHEEKTKVLIILVISTLMVIFSHKDSKSNTNVNHTQKNKSVDTFIPAGFVLVPIEIQNIQNVDSMIGNYGIVDIYNSKIATPILTAARIIRSPLDPTQFAAMVTETDAPTLIAETHEPLRIVLQNPDSRPKIKHKIKSTESRKIFIGGS